MKTIRYRVAERMLMAQKFLDNADGGEAIVQTARGLLDFAALDLQMAQRYGDKWLEELDAPTTLTATRPLSELSGWLGTVAALRAALRCTGFSRGALCKTVADSISPSGDRCGCDGCMLYRKTPDA
jgi:hypothetical protein